ncbi:hypothetical protein J2I47_25930 [Fibrella sp. HMF5335]|uniref:Lipocalin-like domain-containing protein n=1 Tax=Fibrella rubiginis TaxID=2817060 RepID=A0A939GNE5_9BACT|nr:hypothetical protein [Fibrella rubiginis]MBO0940011.1 hypothetical protein [Fibrella rubiginis]
MKKLLLYLSPLCWFLFVSCQWDVSPQSEIVGQWVWEETRGGWNGQDISQPGGKLVVASFAKSNLYEERVDGILSQRGTYRVTTTTHTDKNKKQYTTSDLTFQDLVVYEADGKTERFQTPVALTYMLDISNTTLRYADIIAEGYSHQYRRK